MNQALRDKHGNVDCDATPVNMACYPALRAWVERVVDDTERLNSWITPRPAALHGLPERRRPCEREVPSDATATFASLAEFDGVSSAWHEAT